MAASLNSSLNAIDSGATKRGELRVGRGPQGDLIGHDPHGATADQTAGSSWASVWAGGEQIAALGDALHDRPDRPAVGTELRIVELVPGDRRRDRRARRRPHGVRRDERLDRGVLGVVEARATLPRPLRPFPRDQVGDRGADGPRDPLDPGAGLVEPVARLDRDPDLDAALAGRLGIAADAEVVERGPVQPGEDQRLLPGRPVARVDVDQGEGRLPRLGQLAGPGMDLEARLVAEPGQRRDPIGDQVIVGVAVGAAVEPDLPPARSARPAPWTGCPSARSPGAPAPLGNRCRLSGRSARCGSIVGAIRAK